MQMPWVFKLAKLERRLYIPVHLHPSMRFDIYTDGTVVMFVFGVEVARKHLRKTLDHDIYREFADELASHGIGIAPRGEMGELKKAIEQVSKKVEKLEKEIKKLKR